jgi:hypothetical protein
VAVVSITQPILTGQEIKLDFSMAVDFLTGSNWSVVFEVRLYRGATLINSRILSRSGNATGNQRIPIGNTYVDTAPSDNPTTVYQVRVIVTAASNVTSAATGVSNNLNSITFTP